VCRPGAGARVHSVGADLCVGPGQPRPECQLWQRRPAPGQPQLCRR